MKEDQKIQTESAVPEDAYPFRERRSGKDRRGGPTSLFSSKSLFGSRKGSRRKEDAKKFYLVDLYSPFFMFLLLFTLMLSVLDAFLTIRLLQDSFEEVNPVMAFFLNLGPSAFIISKWVLTTMGMTTLLILKNYYFWGKIRTAVLLVVFPLLYLILITYQVAMVLSL